VRHHRERHRELALRQHALLHQPVAEQLARDVRRHVLGHAVADVDLLGDRADLRDQEAGLPQARQAVEHLERRHHPEVAVLLGRVLDVLDEARRRLLGGAAQVVGGERGDLAGRRRGGPTSRPSNSSVEASGFFSLRDSADTAASIDE
jgi:hypothetical protein